MKLWQYGRYGLLLVLGVGSGVAMWAGGAWMWVGFFVAIALALLYKYGDEEVSIHFYIATALGIGFTMLLTSALMGLVFLSSGTGHDESIEEARKKID